MMNVDQLLFKNLMVNFGTIHLVKNRAIGAAFALVALSLVVSDLHADVRFKPKGHEFELTGKLVGDQLATSLSLGPNGGFAVLFHYPNQILASLQTVKRTWIKRDDKT